jgi:glycerol-3-phosphate dehydrogenase
LPITQSVFEVCYHGLPPEKLVSALMQPDYTPE